MSVISNVDLVNIVDPDEFDVATALSEVNWISRRDGFNRKIAGENVPALIANLTGVLGTFTGSTIPDGQGIKQAFQALETALEALSVNAGTTVQYRSLLSGKLKIEGTSDVTATFASGLLTITILEGGALLSGMFEVETADATYANALVTGGIKIKVVNTANGHVKALHPHMMSRSSSGTVSPTNPLQYNTSINLAIVSDEYDSTGITSWAFQQIGVNAPAGGFIFF